MVGPGLISLQYLSPGSGPVPGAEVLLVAALVRPLVAIFRAWGGVTQIHRPCASISLFAERNPAFVDT